MLNRFTDKNIKGNEEKCLVLLSTDKMLQVKMGAALLNSSKCKKLLGVKIDNKLKPSMYDHFLSFLK